MAAPTADAKVRFLGSDSDTGSSPHVLLFSQELPRPKWMRIDVTLSPVAPVDGSYHVECDRGLASRSVEYGIDGPGRFWGYPTLGKAEDCDVWVSLGYDNYEQGGSITVSAYGGSKPKAKRKKGR